MKNYKRKTDTGKINPVLFKRAAQLVLLENKSIWSVPKYYEVRHVTFFRTLKKLKGKCTITNRRILLKLRINFYCILLENVYSTVHFCI